ncbi:MAG: DUF2291 domain-containing protein [Chitinophagaceae bacterium]
MKKKFFTWVAIALVAALVVYNSVYFKKLSEVKASSLAKQFDPKLYARNFWNKLLPVADTAIKIATLKRSLLTNPDSTFDACSHALGIGNIRYILVKGEGPVKAVYEDEVAISILADSSKKPVRLATEYIFGNAVRDASGILNVSDFTNSMDFNNVSVEINKIIRAEVLPAFKANIKSGVTVAFVGAIELNRKHPNLDDIEVIPVRLKIIKP